MITIKEMANILGMSTTTVSNVIHGKTSQVSPATIELVEKAIKDYGYVPNISARNLAQNNSNIIGIAMKEKKGKYENLISDPFYGELVGAVEKIVRAKGYYLMMYISDDVNEIIKCVNTWNVDGLILASVDYEDVIRLRACYKNPLVLIDCYNCAEGSDEVNVTLDEQKGACEMTEYLIRHGHRKMAYVAYGTEGIAGERYKGCVKALKQYKMPYDQSSFPVIGIGELGLEEAMEAAYRLTGEYTAMICGSDYYAAWLVNYLEDRGIRIPEDLSVTGFDDNEFARIVRPKLTTVRQNVMEKGMNAVRILTDMIEGKAEVKHNILLPFKIVVRDSVKDNLCD